MASDNLISLRKAGRKGKLTRKMIKEIGTLILAGNTIRDICKHLNIAESTFYSWIERGNREKKEYESESVSTVSIYVELVETVDQNQASCVIRYVNLISMAAKDDPKYALEYLKRHRREEWGDYRKEEVQGAIDVKGMEILMELGDKEREIRRRLKELDETSDGGTTDEEESVPVSD